MTQAGHPCVIIPLTDPIISSDASSLTLTPTQRQLTLPSERGIAASTNIYADEREPLLDASSSGNRRKREKKPFYRPRPLWLVPFALLSSIARGMTVAPRIDVYTQLACAESEFKHSSRSHSLIPIPLSNENTTSIPSSALASTPTYTYIHEQSHNARSCSTSPSSAIQARAARLQTTMTTTVGLLSALTTAWWGQFGERHGRMSVLAIASVGLLITDLTFILISLSSSATPLPSPHHNILLAQTLEGILGGWPSLQSAMMAYIADCTQSSASLVRFTGVVYVGLALGPVVGATLIRHAYLFEFIELWSPLFRDRLRALFESGAGVVVTPAFGAAILCSLVNILLVVFVFPESLPKKKRQVPSPPPTISATVASNSTDTRSPPPLSHCSTDETITEDLEEPKANSNILKTILSPLAVFLPQDVYLGTGTGKRRDWSLTMLGVVVFGYMISAGILQMKYMYAKHTYGWGAEQLSYYISWLGGLRAVHLLIILPYIITTFKPKLKPKLKPKFNPTLVPPPSPKPLKPKPTIARLVQQIDFDLGLTRLSILMDVLSHLFVVLSPSPGGVHALVAGGGDSGDEIGGARKHITVEMFIAASSLGSFGAGAFPAVQSLALSIMQLRALHNSSSSDNNQPEDPTAPSNIGALFGALAVLQALGQSILGPLLFGLVYSSTVGTYPKAIFMGAAGVGVGALALLFLVRPIGAGTSSGGTAKAKARRMRLAREMEDEGEVERGRSRVSKDLRGGAVAWTGTKGERGRVSAGSRSVAAIEPALELA